MLVQKSTPILLLVLLATLGGSWAAGLSTAVYGPCSVTPPKPLREFRAAWVATVGNIDWPSKKDLTTAEQQTELLAILDRAAQLNLNVLILQVRPARQVPGQNFADLVIEHIALLFAHLYEALKPFEFVFQRH